MPALQYDEGGEQCILAVEMRIERRLRHRRLSRDRVHAGRAIALFHEDLAGGREDLTKLDVAAVAYRNGSRCDHGTFYLGMRGHPDSGPRSSDSTLLPN